MGEEDVSRVDLQELEARIRGKWFFPILRKIDEFEYLSADMFPEVGTILDGDNCPAWVLNLIGKAGKLDADYTGFVEPEELDARHIGNMVGVKWSICEACVRSYPIWLRLSEKDVTRIEKVYYQGFVAELVETSAKFVLKYAPRFRDVKRFAVDLAENQPFAEYIQYLQGFKQGIEFLGRVRQRMQPTNKKREQDTQTRLAVYGFMMSYWQEIEKHKAELSWREITDTFAEKTGHADIDEATLKKILSRVGLTGIGKVGRPPSR